MLCIYILGIKKIFFTRPTKKETNPFVLIALTTLMVIIGISVLTISVIGFLNSQSQNKHNIYI